MWYSDMFGESSSSFTLRTLPWCPSSLHTCYKDKQQAHGVRSDMSGGLSSDASVLLLPPTEYTRVSCAAGTCMLRVKQTLY